MSYFFMYRWIWNNEPSCSRIGHINETIGTPKKIVSIF